MFSIFICVVACVRISFLRLNNTPLCICITFYLSMHLMVDIWVISTWRLYTWTSADGQYRNHIDYILCSQRWRSSIQSAKTRLEADCGSDHELLIAQFRLKLKKLGKTIWLFSYDLNLLWLYSRSDTQIQGIRSDTQSAWRTMGRGLYIVQEAVIKTIPKKKKCKKVKWFSEEALQIAVKRREVKGKGE